MATTAKSTKTKTKPAKKPATKPAGASVKPKQVKTVKTTAKPKTTNTKPTKTAKSPCRGCEIFFGIIMIVSALAIAAGAICYMFFGIDHDTVNVATGNGGNVVTKYVNIPDYNISVLVPTSFKQLTAEEVKPLYNSDQIKVAYANNDKTAVVSFSQSDDKFTNEEVEKFINTVRTAVNAAGAKDIQTNFYTVDKYNVGTIKFINGGDNVTYPYRYMAVFSKDDKATIVAFECKEELREEWEVVGDAIIKSITFHE